LDKEKDNIDNNNVEEVNDKKIYLTKKNKIILSIVIIISLALTSIFISTKYKNLVYPWTFLNENNLSKLDEDSLNDELDKIKNDISKKKIKINANDKSYEINFSEIIKDYNDEDLEKEIMNYGKDTNLFKQFAIIALGVKREYRFELNIDESYLNKFIDTVYEECSLYPIEPKIYINGNNIKIEDGKNGSIVNKEKLFNDIKDLVESYEKKDNISQINVTYKEIQPNIRIDDLKKVDTKIASFYTEYGTGGGRGKNIEVATSKVDDLLLMPDDEFSYEKVVGPVTSENGYTYATIISNGKLVQGIGGGVCQVSSTIYNAQLKSGILPTERQNHSKSVNYVPKGLDATLASGSIDYKFVNTYDYPIVINAYNENGKIYIEFWSNKKATNGITYEAVSYISGKVANTYLYGYKGNDKIYEKHIDTSIYN